MFFESFTFCFSKHFKKIVTLSKVNVMNSMFEMATSFNQDLSRWDISGIRFKYGKPGKRGMGYCQDMFLDASSFDQVLYWNTTAIRGFKFLIFIAKLENMLHKQNLY